MAVRPIMTGMLLLAALAAQACRLEKDESSASRNPRAAIPGEAASITGVVTDIGPDRRIRIEEQPGESAGSAKAVVRLTEDAKIHNRAGTRATFGDIQNGMRVSAWFTGPVMESYPVQAMANVIVIESGAP